MYNYNQYFDEKNDIRDTENVQIEIMWMQANCGFDGIIIAGVFS